MNSEVTSGIKIPHFQNSMAPRRANSNYCSMLNSRQKIPCFTSILSLIYFILNIFALYSCKVEPEDCLGTCLIQFNCCQTSNHCLNNRTCVLSSSPNGNQRAVCRCSNGFVGNRCETKARSCRSYKNRPNGQYSI